MRMRTLQTMSPGRVGLYVNIDVVNGICIIVTADVKCRRCLYTSPGTCKCRRCLYTSPDTCKYRRCLYVSLGICNVDDVCVYRQGSEMFVNIAGRPGMFVNVDST